MTAVCSIPDLSEKTEPVAVSGLDAGTVHAMSQTAGGYYDLPHGVLTAAMLPPVMAYNYLGEPAKYARIAQAMRVNTWGMTLFEALYRAFEQSARRAGPRPVVRPRKRPPASRRRRR